MLTEVDLRHLRDEAIHAHQPWKNRIILCDAVEDGRWRILWPDGSVDSSEPLVENIYAEALEDKTITAGALPPILMTQPTRGTRKDQGEQNAARRRRVGLSYWERSAIRDNLQKLYRDLLHTGVCAAAPWATGFSGRDRLPADQRFAYFEVIDPRSLYPLGWDSRGRLASTLVMRQRRIADMNGDWGPTHPALVEAKVRHAMRGERYQLEWLEEIWYADSQQWAVALADSMLPAPDQGVTFTRPGVEGSRMIAWLVEPQEHGLGQCPIKAKARTTVQDVPRGALLDVIPQLKTAQNFMARHLDDLQANIYAPVVLDNIKNPHEYGLGAVLVGTGQGKAFIDRDRPPVNFEAQQTIAQILESARRQAMEPAQRSGEAGAAIVSAKGTIALMGTFNAELAASQSKIESILSELTSATAAFDEKWCAGRKQVWVLDQTGKMEDESYDPATLFKGDHRFRVTYGDRTGLDENQHTTRVSMVKQLGGMSDRTFMQKTGVVDDVLDEETEIFLSKMMTLVSDQLLPQQFMAGDREAVLKIWKAIDTDQKTARQAVFEMLEETSIAASPDGQPPDPMSAAGRADTLLMARSLMSGGIPGNAEGQPALPGPARRMAGQLGPGGTAT